MLTHFAMGRLDMAGIEEVCEHLEVCSQCAKTLNGLQVSDTLLDALNHRSGGQPSAEPVLRELLSRVQALGVTPDSEADDVPLAARLACLRPRETADELGRLGPYRILQVIGVGGMGTVFLAEHLEHQGRVALKVMRPGLSDSASGRKRFLREIQALISQNHPAIVPVLDVGEDNDVPYFAMPLLRGETLEARLKRDGQLPVTESIHIAREIASGLAAAHEQGLIHRDIKPTNVFLCRESEPEAVTHGSPTDSRQPAAAVRVMLMDFGLARMEGQSSWQTQAGTVLGTPHYIAPEQIDGAEVDGRADLFSLGCVLFRMCTATLPFIGQNPMSVLVAVTHDVPPSVTELNPQVPLALAELIGCLLSKDRELRPQTAGEVREQLEAIARNPDIKPFRLAIRPQKAAANKATRRSRRMVLALALLAIPVLLMIASWVSRDRRVVLLKDAIQSELEAADWSPASLEQVEEQLKTLATFDPQQTALFRRRLMDRFRDATLRLLDQPRLDADTLARVEQHVVAMQSRSPDESLELARRLQDRLHKWETVFDLTPSTSDLDQWFDRDIVRSAAKTIHVGQSGVTCRALSRVESVGNVRMDAVFDPSWESAADIGLLCHAGTETGGYAFVLSSEPQLNRKVVAIRNDGGVSFAIKRQDGLPFYLSILRNGVCQREIQVRIPSGALSIRATRDGDRLDVQVNNESPLTYVDAFPIPSQRGLYGLLADGELHLTRLHAQRQALPIKPSPLESGDELLSREQFADALAAYQRQVVADPHTETGQELQYKKSLCLVHLKRPDEAIEGFTKLMAEPGARWPLLGACQLWLLRLQQNGFDQAQAVQTELSARFRPEDLLVSLPEELRRSIMDRYLRPSSATNVLFYDPHRLIRAEQAVDVANFLQVPPNANSPNRWGLQQTLMRSYLLAGQPAPALQTARQWFQQCETLPRSEQLVPLHLILCDYLWLMQTRGDAKMALTELDHWLYSAPGVLVEESVPSAKMLLERVRLHVALDDWAAAEKDVTECFRLLENPNVRADYAVHSGTHLLHGFLCERRGDLTAATDAWRRGTFKAWKQQVPRELWGDDVIGPNYDSRGLQDLIMASLCGEFTDGDALDFWNRTVAGFNNNELIARLSRSIPAAPAISRLWRSSRGRDYARRIAFHEVPYAEYIGLTPRLLATEILFHGAYGGTPTAAQDEFVWGLVKDGHEMYARGELSQAQLVSLGLFWSLTGSAGTWPLLSNTLPNSLRAPVAYVMGQRFAQRGNLADAAKMFRQALTLAPTESPLRDLVQAALERLPGDVRSAP